MSGGVRENCSDQEYDALSAGLHAAFSRADAPEVLSLLHHRFDTNIYSLKSLFRDDQTKILDIILAADLAQAEASLIHQYEQEAPLMRFLAGLHVDQPKLFRTLAEFALNRRLRTILASENISPEKVEGLLQETREMKIPLDTSTLEFVIRRQTEERARAFWANPGELAGLQRLEATVQLARSLPFPVNLWQVQNLCAEKLDGTYSAIQREAEQGDEDAKTWIRHMSALAKTLDLKVA